MKNSARVVAGGNDSAMPQSTETWACICCGQIMRRDQHCGCWVCRCSERYAEDVGFLNVAGEPCSVCGHEKGACDCVECVRHCGFLHPVGFVCEPPLLTDDDVPF